MSEGVKAMGFDEDERKECVNVSCCGNSVRRKGTGRSLVRAVNARAASR